MNTGGTETMLVDIANEQAKTENVSIIIVNKNINESITDKISKNIKVYRINRILGSRNPIKIVKLNLLLKKSNPDIIHCHNHTLINLIRIPLKAKVYLTVHGLQYPTINLKKYDKLFAISDSVKNDILSHDNLKVQVVYNGIKTESLKQKENGRLKKIFKIVQVGRLDHEKKGQHILINALAQLKHNQPEIHFTLDIIGEGSSLNYLQQLVKETGLNNDVFFIENKSRNYVYDNLYEYDLLVQPSVYEGFGLTVAEAMAAKVPVLVSNIHGPMEIIKNGKYGAYFETENVNDCAKKIAYIFDNYIEYKNIAERALEFCQNNFSISSTARNYIKHY